MTAGTVTRPTLKKGDRGPDVKALQELLKVAVPGVALAIDSVFGEQTDLSVRVFQSRVFLEDDGIVGAKTWKALQSSNPTATLPVLRRGSTGKDVERVQRALTFSTEVQNTLGFPGFYFGRIDGDFGPKTEEAVKAFQKNPIPSTQPLTADGVIGAITWKALSGLVTRVSHIFL
jgi:peptidoglycan hydrolase-like protein with peptidoglycan-binding domain